MTDIIFINMMDSMRSHSLRSAARSEDEVRNYKILRITAKVVQSLTKTPCLGCFGSFKGILAVLDYEFHQKTTNTKSLLRLF